MKNILCVVMIFMSMLNFNNLAYAQQSPANVSVQGAGFDKLTVEQKAEVIKQISVLSNNNVKDQLIPGKSITTDDLDKWANFGEKIGKGLGAAAKQLNIAVNEFADTTVGKIAIALIVWNFFGEAVVMIFVGLSVWIIGFTVIYKIQKLMRNENITYSSERVNIFKNPVVEKRTTSHLDGIEIFLLTVASFGVLLVGSLIIANI